MNNRRIKRMQSLSILSAAQLQTICDDHYIEGKWSGAYHLRNAVLDEWERNEDSSIDVDVSEMIRSMIK